MTPGNIFGWSNLKNVVLKKIFIFKIYEHICLLVGNNEETDALKQQSKCTIVTYKAA